MNTYAYICLNVYCIYLFKYVCTYVYVLNIYIYIWYPPQKVYLTAGAHVPCSKYIYTYVLMYVYKFL